MLIEVELSKIIIDEKRQDQIIVLKEVDGERQIPIVIGFIEATNIKMVLSGVEAPRPLTHDLIVSIIDALGADMDKLVIDDLVDSTFYSKVDLRAEDAETLLIDARPSDGIALAVRFSAPIYVEEEIIEKASIFEV